ILVCVILIGFINICSAKTKKRRIQTPLKEVHYPADIEKIEIVNFEPLDTKCVDCESGASYYSVRGASFCPGEDCIVGIFFQIIGPRQSENKVYQIRKYDFKMQKWVLIKKIGLDKITGGNIIWEKNKSQFGVYDNNKYRFSVNMKTKNILHKQGKTKSFKTSISRINPQGILSSRFENKKSIASVTNIETKEEINILDYGINHKWIANTQKILFVQHPPLRIGDYDTKYLVYDIQTKKLKRLVRSDNIPAYEFEIISIDKSRKRLLIIYEDRETSIAILRLGKKL
ncbi:MAG: hypothetical protein ACLFP1_08605, partial [Candidatus Goldiibacteriota bacterium]